MQRTGETDGRDGRAGQSARCLDAQIKGDIEHMRSKASHHSPCIGAVFLLPCVRAALASQKAKFVRAPTARPPVPPARPSRPSCPPARPARPVRPVRPSRPSVPSGRPARPGGPPAGGAGLLILSIGEWQYLRQSISRINSFLE